MLDVGWLGYEEFLTQRDGDVLEIADRDDDENSPTRHRLQTAEPDDP